MALLTYRPRPPLSAFVDILWLAEGDAPAHPKERLLPTGTVELVIDLRNDTLRVYDGQRPDRFQTFRGAVVCGAHSQCFVIDTVGQESVLGVHFKPGGAFPFLG